MNCLYLPEIGLNSGTPLGGSALIATPGFAGLVGDGNREKYDQSGMYDGVWTLPEQLAEGLALGLEHFSPTEPDRRVVIFGMGASGIVGDLIASWVGDPSRVLPVGGYDAPSDLRDNDLAVAISFSGDTEETLSAFTAALDAGVEGRAVTGGGAVASLCRERGFDVVEIPKTVQARAALGYLFGATASLLGEDRTVELRAAIPHVEDLRKDLDDAIDAPRNKAKGIAAAMEGKTACVLADAVHYPVARRWVTQFHENSKVLAWASLLPESNHNEIVPWAEDPGAFLPIILRGPEESPEMRRRLDITAEIIGEARPVVTVQLPGDTRLRRLLGGSQLGDFCSFYHAILRGIDPTPQRAIDALKRRLRAPDA
jgi:glucose/mannose-6-phosphate isomerase